jgi:serine/threonine protein phosphatase 1
MTWAIGDVHGCRDTLRAMVEDRIGLSKGERLVLLGDYIDRGPRSRETLDYVRQLQLDGYDVIALRGNHDDLLIRARFSSFWEQVWLRNGGVATMFSFKATRVTDIPMEYVDLVESMPFTLRCDPFLAVHASLNFEREEPLDDVHSMLFARLPRVDRERIDGLRLLCGHTPTVPDVIATMVEADKCIIDAGCVYVDREGMGNLCALNIDTLELVFQRNIDFDNS